MTGIGTKIRTMANGFAERISSRFSALKTPRLIKAAEYIVRFVAGYLLGCGNIFSASPFGVGAIGAAPPGIRSLITFFGACLGWLTVFPIVDALQYICAGLLVMATLYIFRAGPVPKRAWFAPSITAFFALITGGVYAADAGWSLNAVSILVTQVLLSGGSCYFYKKALAPWSGTGTDANDDLSHTASLLLLAATAISPLCSIKISGLISIGRIIALLLVMYVGFRGGLNAGCCCGVAIGAAMDLAIGAIPYFSLCFGLGALISGCFSKHGRFAFVLTFIVATAAVAFWSHNASFGVALMYETFISAVIFMLLPLSSTRGLGRLFSSRTHGLGAVKARDYTRARIDETAECFEMIYTSAKACESEENEADPANLFDRAADKVCVSCKKHSECWGAEYESTRGLMNDLTILAEERGEIEEDDFPDWFAARCEKLGEYASALNGEIKSRICQNKCTSRFNRQLSAAYNQYAEIASVLRSLSCELGGGYGTEPEIECSLQRYLHSIDIESSTAVFRDKNGRLHAELNGDGLYLLRRDDDWLDSLSTAVGKRLCTPTSRNTARKIVLLEAEPLAVTVGVAGAKKRGQIASGDSDAFFKTDEGKMYVILSDGMGSGDLAARDSSETVEILAKFLHAGTPPEIALNILSNLMLLKSESDLLSCATVDLCCIDLFTGETQLFKYGAAPSYIKGSDGVRCVRSRSFPAGLNTCDSGLTRTRLNLAPGSIAVILSDGVTDGSDDAWLKNCLSGFEGSDPKALARLILQSAANRTGIVDDMTVLVVMTEERR